MVDEIPGGLDLVRRFVNTLDVEAGEDRLATEEGLRSWLVEHGLIGPAETLTEADRGRAVEVREALRAVLAAHHRHRLDERAVAVLNRTGSAAELAVAFAEDGRPFLHPRAGGVDRAVGRILAEVARAEAEGTWERLKVCFNEACRWAFYDRSKNRSGKWCSMAVCGNRMKARAYRERRAEAST